MIPSRLLSEYLFLHPAKETSIEDFHSRVRKSVEVLVKCFKKRSLRACIYDENITKKTFPVKTTKLLTTKMDNLLYV